MSTWQQHCPSDAPVQVARQSVVFVVVQLKKETWREYSTTSVFRFCFINTGTECDKCPLKLGGLLLYLLAFVAFPGYCVCCC